MTAKNKVAVVETKGTDMFIKTRAAAKLIGKSVSTIGKAIRAGELRAVEVPNASGTAGKSYLVKRSDLLKWAAIPKRRGRKGYRFKGYYTIVEASEVVNIPESTIDKAMKAGCLPFEEKDYDSITGYCYAIKREDLRRWKADGAPIVKVKEVKAAQETVEVQEAAEVKEVVKEEAQDAVKVAEKAKPVVKTLADYSDEEIAAEIVNRIKSAFSSGYEKGVAEGRLEMKKAVLTAIDKL